MQLIQLLAGGFALLIAERQGELVSLLRARTASAAGLTGGGGGRSAFALGRIHDGKGWRWRDELQWRIQTWVKLSYGSESQAEAKEAGLDSCQTSSKGGKRLCLGRLRWPTRWL